MAHTTINALDLMLMILVIVIIAIFMNFEAEIFKLKLIGPTKLQMSSYQTDRKKDCCVDIDTENMGDCLQDFKTLKNTYPNNMLKTYGNRVNHNSNYEISKRHYMNSWNLSLSRTVCLCQVSGGNLPKEVNGIPWSSMKNELYRLQTFSRYSREASVSPLLLARKGFVYIGNGDEDEDTVVCFFCLVAAKNLDTIERVESLHCNLSANCPMVTGQACQNICIQKRSETSFSNIFSHLQSSEHNSIENHSRSTGTGQIVVREVENRRETLTSRPMASLSGKIVLQEQGFENTSTFCLKNRGCVSVSLFGSHEYTAPFIGTAILSNVTWHRNQAQSLSPPSSEDTNPEISTGIFTAQHLASPAARPDAVLPQSHSLTMSHRDGLTSRQEGIGTRCNRTSNSESARPHVHDDTNTSNSTTSRPGHADNSATSPPQTVSDSQEAPSSNSTSYGKLGIITARPKRPEYAVEITRLNSFEGWPEEHHIKAEDLAKAGYFYTGYSDAAICFYCGGGLRNWEVGDDVWVEHAKWFPECAFMRQTVGQPFIDDVQKLKKKREKIYHEEVMREHHGVEHEEFAADSSLHSRQTGENSQPQRQNQTKISTGKELCVVFRPCGHHIPCKALSNLSDCPLCKKSNT